MHEKRSELCAVSFALSVGSGWSPRFTIGLHMRKFVVCLFLIGAAFAQKQPITLETLSQAGRGGRGGRGGFDGPQVWMPDGKSFLFRQGRNLMAYDPATKSSKAVMSLEALD